MSSVTSPDRPDARKSPDELARDFDAIAEALRQSGRSDRLSPAERSLLRHVPAGARWAVDVGCGDGQIVRALAHRGLTVLGIDLSPRMIELARSRTAAGLPVRYKQGDVMHLSLPQRSFDVVVSSAMLHHLPLPAIVRRLAELVAPGGVLLVQDILQRRGLRYLPLNVLAYARTLMRRVTRRERNASEVRSLYDAHGAGESYLRPSQVAAAYRELLPGARVTLHVDWRYSVIWHRKA